MPTSQEPASRQRHKLELIAEKLVAKVIEGDNWCIGQVGDRLDGKPKQRQEHEGVVDDVQKWPISATIPNNTK
jgi:hypothetical protein